MKRKELQDLANAEPFAAFLLQLDDKTEAAVHSKDALYIPPVESPYIWVSGDEGGPRCIQLTAIVGIRMLRPPRRKKAG